MEQNRNLLVALVVIGIIIIILLIAPTLSHTRLGYYPSNFTASTVSLDATPSRNNGSGYYTIYRYVPPYSSSTVTTYTYSSTPAYDYSGEQMFSDGCTMTSPYSLTTGEPCS